MTTRAPAPKRATKTLNLSFGPIPIECSIYSGAEDVGVKRSEYVLIDGDLHAVGRKPYDKVTGGDVETENVKRLIQTDNGLVEVTDEEIESLVQFPAETAEVVKFLPLNLLMSGHYVPTDVHQIRPKRNSKTKTVNANVERAFGLMLQAMRKTQTFALVKFTFRGSPKYGAILSTGRLYSLAFDENIREDLPLPSVEYSDSEIDLMVRIVKSMASPDPVPISDEASQAILEYAAKKASGDEAVKPIVRDQPEELDAGSLEAVLTSMLQHDSAAT